MFFNSKNKELKKEITSLKALNKEYEEKCEYYQDRYSQIKSDYTIALRKNENFNNAFRENFSELSSKLISLEVSLVKLEENNKMVIKSENIIKRFQEIECEIVKLSKEICRLSSFLEKHTSFNKNTSTYQSNLEKSYNSFK
ncbi:hypothetical protein [uncultured Cetobacterium sp.]|uniref:hypothetical protein n=1 Tax=uncultured Cetobacterium sp. TaxID=527638 RepID=UPI0026399708|nr:hypothetical protein [uncultured Cetobacterium sp.]